MTAMPLSRSTLAVPPVESNLRHRRRPGRAQIQQLPVLSDTLISAVLMTDMAIRTAMAG